jgi:hypothetical protein
MSVPQRSPQKPTSLQTELPANLDAVYSNMLIIQHSPSKFVLDFAFILPNMPAARVGARMVMTPCTPNFCCAHCNIERF